MSHRPTDWTTGERVFAPPSGTIDVDWLVPALLEQCDVPPTEARAALADAWAAIRDGRDPDREDHLRRTAAEIVEAARRSFGG